VISVFSCTLHFVMLKPEARRHYSTFTHAVGNVNWSPGTDIDIMCLLGGPIDTSINFWKEAALD